MANTPVSLTVQDAIDRPLTVEPQSVIRVSETASLRTDIGEYVLTDRLARDMCSVFEQVVEAAHPAGGGTGKVGVWVSGFFGSGKSHFAKLVGHLLADTKIDHETSRDLFSRLLHLDRQADRHLQELFQQATTYQLSCHVVPFDITAVHSQVADHNVGLTLLRALYASLGLSTIIPFAECELELQSAGKYGDFLASFQSRTGAPWAQEKDLTICAASLADCLAELLPGRFSTPDLAHRSLEMALNGLSSLSVDGVIDRMLRWLDAVDSKAGKGRQRLVLVADEVGAWASRDRNRIEQIRTFVEGIGTKGKGRIWLIATSQEKLSAIVQDTPTLDQKGADFLLQRLSERFGTNIHLESSEVGTVIEDRILRKRPTSRPALAQLWDASQQQLRDIAERPGLEMGANYPKADREPFVRDYPFLPYQLQAAADIFGGMRGVKVSSGARSMIRVAFEATRDLAKEPVGVVVSWDRIFDCANRGNEFADEQYLGSDGLTYLESADQHVQGTALKPSRVLKALWLVQQTSRIPRSVPNLARLLVTGLDQNVLELELGLQATLESLAERSFVRQEVATSQWRFLTQDQVTVERIVQRIARDIKQRDIRKEVFDLYSAQLGSLFTGRITAGKSNTSFEYGLYLNDTAQRNEQTPVSLSVAMKDAEAAKRAVVESRVDLESPVVFWVLDVPQRLEEQLSRAMAVLALKNDEEYRRVATERMKAEADKLELEASTLRRDAEVAVEKVFGGGVIYYAGTDVVIPPAGNGNGSGGSGQASTARSKVEAALRNRIEAKYHRFREGDRQFNAANIDKLFTVPAGDRGGLDPALALFGPEGHVHGNNVLVEELGTYLKSSSKTAGQEVATHFSDVPFGWPPDLIRYVAAAMFVDGKLSLRDKAGKRYDDPKAPGTKNQFATLAFRSIYLELEEDSLTPDESTRARTLLTDLGHPSTDGGEIALREATLLLLNDITKRLAVVDKAKVVEFPLPLAYGGVPTILEDVSEAGSRVKVVRSLLAHAQDLRDDSASIKRLEQFNSTNGFEQYRRSQQLLEIALQSGLTDEPSVGATVQQAAEQLHSLKEQRRVLDEWAGAYSKYRLELLDAYRSVYTPLRAELYDRSTKAADAITQMPEYKALKYGDAAVVRTQFLAEGKPLYKVEMPELLSDEQLLQATSRYNIAHLRSALAALDSQVGLARAMVLDLYFTGIKKKVVTWKPADAFAGKHFKTEAEVDQAFDAERDRLKDLIKKGNEIQVL